MNKKIIFTNLKQRLSMLIEKLGKNFAYNKSYKFKQIIEENYNQIDKFIKIYLPYSSDYSKENLINRFYDTVFINSLSNNIVVKLNRGEWDIVLSHLYNLFFSSGLLQYFETCYCYSIFTNLEENESISINNFLDNFIIPPDLQFGQTPIDIYAKNICYVKISNDLGKYMVNHIEQYIYK